MFGAIFALILKIFPKERLIKALPDELEDMVGFGLTILEVVDTPEERSQLLALAQRIYKSLDTHAERRAAFLFFMGMFVDGKVEVGEWSRFGSMAGILGKIKG